MKRFIFIPFFVITTTSLFSQPGNTSIVSKKDITHFLNDLYKNDRFLHRLKLVDQPFTHYFFRYHLKKNELFYRHFDTTDLASLQQQICQGDAIRWDSSYVFRSSFISSEEFDSIFLHDNGWTNFHQQHGDGYYAISFPIFSFNRDYCVLYIEYSIGGLGGSGEIRFYKKGKLEWKLEKTVAVWDS
jgi:hypothetical protein